MESRLNFKEGLPKIIIGAMRLGSWGVDLGLKELAHFVDACVERGLVHFDHADIYGGHSTQLLFGRLFDQRPDLKTRIRIHSKCGIIYPSELRPQYPLKYYDNSPAHIHEAVDEALREFGIEQLEALLLHRPDLLLEPEAVGEAFFELKHSGKVKHFGVSNFQMHEMEALYQHYPYDIHQLEVSLVESSAMEDGRLYTDQKLGLCSYAWSPLGGGRIFAPTNNESEQRLRAAIESMAEEKGVPVDTLLYAWLLRHPAGIGLVTGTSKVERLDNVLQALDVSFSRMEWYTLYTAACGRKLA